MSVAKAAMESVKRQRMVPHLAEGQGHYPVGNQLLFIAVGIGITPILPMIAAAEALLTAVEKRCAAWLPSALRVERFSPKPLTEPALSGVFEVVLQRSELTLAVPPDGSILSLVEEAGVGALSSCNEGTCEIRVLAGQPDHRDSVLTREERQANNCMMICVSRSCTRRLVLDIWVGQSYPSTFEP